MNDIEILNQIDNIYHEVDGLRTTPLKDLDFNVILIRNALDALQEKVEDAFYEKEYEMECLKANAPNSREAN